MTSSEELLDDVARLEAGDPGRMLPDVASGAAQVREAAVLAAEAGIARLAEDGRPRAVVVCGMGGSGIAGDVLAAVAGPAARSRSSRTAATGCPPGSARSTWSSPCRAPARRRRRSRRSRRPSAAAAGCWSWASRARRSTTSASAAARCIVPVTQGRQPRASMWALSTPLVLAAAELGLLSAPAEVVEEAARTLEEVADRCRVDAASLVNPAKRLALDLQDRLPVLWGT